MVSFSRIRGNVEEDLGEQVAALRKELAAVSRTLGKRGGKAYDASVDALSDTYDEIWDRFQDYLPVLRKRAKVIEQTARENPTVTTAAVSLVVIGLLATWLLKRD